MSHRRACALALLIITGVVGLLGVEVRASEPPTYEVFAVRYATMPAFPVYALVQGAQRERRLDIAMTIWVLKGPDGRTVLVDSGFYRPRLLKERKIADHVRPDKALERLGIRPEEVTDVIITHMHWDHADGVDLFPKRRSGSRRTSSNTTPAMSSNRSKSRNGRIDACFGDG